MNLGQRRVGVGWKGRKWQSGLLYERIKKNEHENSKMRTGKLVSELIFGLSINSKNF